MSTRARRQAVSVLICLGVVACSSGPSPAPVLDRASIVAAVRGAMDAGAFDAAGKLLQAHEAALGVSPQMLLAQSWLGRGALGSVRLADAERYATRTYDQGARLLESRGMDDEPDLPIAMGAAIEVLAQVGVRRGARSEAVLYLEDQLRRFAETSIPKRIQKNINLITLEGQPMLKLSTTEWLGTGRTRAEGVRGNVQVLFFWAHWCSDCKTQGPVLARLIDRYRNDGLSVVAPTQRFGYVAGGQPAPPDVELRYIEAVRDQYYPWLSEMPVPLDEANHLSYGVSTTPTMVVVDRDGIIRRYHPGRLTDAELDLILRPLLFETDPGAS